MRARYLKPAVSGVYMYVSDSPSDVIGHPIQFLSGGPTVLIITVSRRLWQPSSTRTRGMMVVATGQQVRMLARSVAAVTRLLQRCLAAAATRRRGTCG